MILYITDVMCHVFIDIRYDIVYYRCYVSGMSLERTKIMANCTSTLTNVTETFTYNSSAHANVTGCDIYNVTVGPPVDAVVEYWEYVYLLTNILEHEF
jgi:hypothetical protein